MSKETYETIWWILVAIFAIAIAISIGNGGLKVLGDATLEIVAIISQWAAQMAVRLSAAKMSFSMLFQVIVWIVLIGMIFWFIIKILTGRT